MHTWIFAAFEVTRKAKLRVERDEDAQTQLYCTDASPGRSGGVVVVVVVGALVVVVVAAAVVVVVSSCGRVVADGQRTEAADSKAPAVAHR
jgi:urease accessory protein UreE